MARARGNHGDAETQRLGEDGRRDRNWKRWGPYLSERQWATVREDYSPNGDPWRYFPHEHARSRAYRWGEDGLLGICDRQCRLCFAIALYNGVDPILKERLFGLTGPEGNHGEDVKELYFYLDSTPTHSYLRGLYKYPQRPFPYAELVAENQRRGHRDPEYDLPDTGIFDDGRYFDVEVEYAKASPDDILIRITVHNRGPAAAPLTLLPTVWFRNTWSWGRKGEGYLLSPPSISLSGPSAMRLEHPELGDYRFALGPADDGKRPTLLFTDNETNDPLLWDLPHQPGHHYKDAFHRYVVDGDTEAVRSEGRGTKAAGCYRMDVPADSSVVVHARLYQVGEGPSSHPFGERFREVFRERRQQADAFYEHWLPRMPEDERNVVRQAFAGLLWTKQFYHYVVNDWLEGDPAHPAPPPERRGGRNHEWSSHLYNRDVISMPDKWEYPWYAAWDLAFHMLPFAEIDADFAKQQLELFLREWYMHPNGQIPAYEYKLSDVNPPVHAWAAWRVYKMTGKRGHRDRQFLSHVFQKLLMNFTWWVNRKDPDGNNVFSGGFLGLDNIGVFDRSQPLPGGGELEQADGTAWMAFYCGTMLSMAFELAREDPASEDLASKFLEHFVAIASSINHLGGAGLWDEADGFYYDRLLTGDGAIPLKVRSMVGIIPLFAVEVLELATIEKLPGFKKRLRWFMEERPEIARRTLAWDDKHLLVALVQRDRLVRILRYVLDENELLSPYGVRSLSRVHQRAPYVLHLDGQPFRVDYVPGESESGMFGGNSNWRGPVWFPVNYLLLEALERYAHFYPDLEVECPTGSGRMMTLDVVADELCARLGRLFLRDDSGQRPCHGTDRRFADDPHFRELVLFYEYFHGDDGRGLGASHQTGWTALVTRCIEQVIQRRRRREAPPGRDAMGLHSRAVEGHGS